MSNIQHIPEQIKLTVDAVSISTVIATFLTTWMPPLAAVASLIWALLRIYDTWLDIQRKRKHHGD